MIPYPETDPLEPVFSYCTNGVHTHFLTDRINAWCREIGRPMVPVPLTTQLVDSIASDNGIEHDHVERVVAKGLVGRDPALFVDWSNGFHTCIDGNHRIIAAHRLGYAIAPAWIVTRAECEPFVTDITDPSGVPHPHCRTVFEKVASGEIIVPRRPNKL